MNGMPELEYNRHAQSVYVKFEGDWTRLHSNASPEEFAVISDIDDLAIEASALSDKLINLLMQSRELVQKNQYFATLSAFQEEAGEHYQECLRFQSVAKASDSDIVKAQLGILYKLDKFLKHYFRELSVAQSLGFSERLLFTYLSTNDYVFLYGFARNTCSTLEYLGKLLESRQGQGALSLADESVTFKQIYREIQKQGLGETFADSQLVRIPETDEQMQMGEIGLGDSEMDFLWDKRNDIVHHCPIVVEEETVEHLPEDILTAAVLTQADIERVTRLAARVHLHSIGMFLKFSSGYMMDLVEKLVEARYHENPTE
ncbi:hypothetical protein [Halobacterium wangiae]|uniref:hypothetical protein n=1 Tax=Halobacterium wangiae TaxID=2902623 RepID=UPI001E5BEE2A|nr:hypothetical protein [Halobacterium wangiae]